MTDDPVAIVKCIHAQFAKACEMANEAISGGCDLPEIRGAYAKGIGAMTALERVFEPVRPDEADLIMGNKDE